MALQSFLNSSPFSNMAALVLCGWQKDTDLSVTVQHHCCTVSLMDVYKLGNIIINQVYIFVNNVYTLTSVFLGNTRKVCLHLPTLLHQSLHGHVACHRGQSWMARQSLTGDHMHSFTHTYIYTYITYIHNIQNKSSVFLTILLMLLSN